MKKKLWLMTLLSGAAVTLAACGGEASPSPAAQEKTPTASAIQTSSAPATSAGAVQKAAKCVVVRLPVDSAIPAPTKDDWSQGSETASLTIIEYGDFQ